MMIKIDVEEKGNAISFMYHPPQASVFLLITERKGKEEKAIMDVRTPEKM